MLDHVRGVLEDVVGEDHDAETALVAGGNFESAFKNEAGTGAGHEAFILAKLQSAGVGKIEVDLENFVDKRWVKELGDTELGDIAQTRYVVSFGGLNGDDFDLGILLAKKPTDTRDSAAGAE